jgi:hypothetical protein
VEREQRAQVRTERAAAARIDDGDPGPPTVLRALSRVPGFPRLAGRRHRVEIPAPADTIAAGAPSHARLAGIARRASDTSQ